MANCMSETAKTFHGCLTVFVCVLFEACDG